MDEVQKFISENQHQFGYIMQEASRQWIAKDPIGALTVGQCAGTIKANGAYLQLLDKVERYEKALKEIEEARENYYLNEYVEAVEGIVQKALTE